MFSSNIALLGDTKFADSLRGALSRRESVNVSDGESRVSAMMLTTTQHQHSVKV